MCAVAEIIINIINKLVEEYRKSFSPCRSRTQQKIHTNLHQKDFRIEIVINNVVYVLFYILKIVKN